MAPWDSVPPSQPMSVLLPKADICSAPAYVCFGPKADMSALIRSPRPREAGLAVE